MKRSQDLLFKQNWSLDIMHLERLFCVRSFSSIQPFIIYIRLICAAHWSRRRESTARTGCHSLSQDWDSHSHSQLRAIQSCQLTLCAPLWAVRGNRSGFVNDNSKHFLHFCLYSAFHYLWSLWLSGFWAAAQCSAVQRGADRGRSQQRSHAYVGQ